MNRNSFEAGAWKRPLAVAVLGTALCLPAAALAAGSVGGSVKFTGTAPVPEKLSRSSDPTCGKGEVLDPSVLVSKTGQLQNVVVRLMPETPPAKATPPSTPVVLDQTGCMYSPRVQGAVEGQSIAIRNSDGTLHNVHGYDGTKTLFNVAQPPKGPEVQKPAMGKGGDILKFKCDVHPWMTAYVVLSKTPHFATSGADGKFEIPNVPAGRYSAEAWHEKLGTQKMSVTVEEGKPVNLSFSFAAK